MPMHLSNWQGKYSVEFGMRAMVGVSVDDPDVVFPKCIVYHLCDLAVPVSFPPWPEAESLHMQSVHRMPLNWKLQLPFSLVTSSEQKPRQS